MTDFEAKFQSTMCRLLLYSPFSFNLLVAMETIPCTTLETMGVCVKNGRLTLRYNPDFFLSLEEGERSYVLIHEMMHVLLHHCTHRRSSDMRRAYKENVAMDLAINCLVLETTGIKIPRFKEDVGGKKKGEVMALLPSMFGFANGLSFEQYLDLLDAKFPDPEIQFVTSGDVEGDGSESGEGASGDGSSEGNESSEKKTGSSNKTTVVVEIDENCNIGKITKHRIEAKHGEGYDEDPFIDDYVRNTVEQIERNHSWGSLGSNAVELVKKAQEQPLNWGDILRLKMGPFLSYQKMPSRRRWNKHYGKPFLGNTTKSVEPVAVYADTSGSVGSADLSRFIVEIERIANYTGVYLWSFDTKVCDPDESVLFTRRSIDSIEFKGRGGTCFTPVFEHAKSKNFTQVVVLTDGYAETISPDVIEGMDVIWVIIKGGDTENKAGVVIEMDR